MPAPELDAFVLRRAMALYHGALEEHRDELDSLNVFPVPDGDTGTNLLLTQRAVARDLDALDAAGGANGPRPADISETIRRSSLMAARGNSGVILAQVLQAFCEHVGTGDGRVVPGRGGVRLSDGLREAHRAARGAVADPKEGTVLTVLADAAIAAEGAAKDGGDAAETAMAAFQEARASLARTPGQLAALARAGVVDAGGLGLVLLLDAIVAAMTGRAASVPVGTYGPLARRGVDAAADGEGPRADALVVGLDGPFDGAFEVQFLLEAGDEAIDPLRRALSALGSSVVVAGSRGSYAVHVHTDAPDRTLQEGRGAGVVLGESITSLERQVAACVGAGPGGASAGPALTGLVAVAEGDGLEAAFRSLGATVVSGGPGRNPSVGELVATMQATAAGAVIVLPNHPNIVPAARLAVQESGAQGFVVDARSIPAGLAAAAAFVPDATADANVEAMTKAVAMPLAGEVAEATLAAQTPAGPVRVGDWVGTREGTVLEVGPDPAPVAIALVERLRRDRPDAEVLTVVLGDGAEGEGPAGDPVVAALRAANEDLRLDALPGGQPRLRYLIGLE